MKLLVGDSRGALPEIAQALDPTAILIGNHNWQDTFGVGYTSLREFPDKSIFLELLLRADQIEYHPPHDAVYNTSDITSTHDGYEQFLVTLANMQKATRPPLLSPATSEIAHKLQRMSRLVDTRRTEWPQLWAAGCSITIGVGVEPQQQWGEIVALDRNMHVSFLAYGGSSNPWAADQILRSDIRKGDIVVWALTNNERWHIFKQDGTFARGNPANYEENRELRAHMPKALLYGEPDHWAANTVQSILQVQNYCRRVGADLFVIGGVLSNNEILLYMYDNPVYHHFYNPELVFTVDRGTDGVHPGPVQHQRYADFILKQIGQRLTPRQSHATVNV